MSKNPQKNRNLENEKSNTYLTLAPSKAAKLCTPDPPSVSDFDEAIDSDTISVDTPQDTTADESVEDAKDFDTIEVAPLLDYDA